MLLFFNVKTPFDRRKNLNRRQNCGDIVLKQVNFTNKTIHTPPPPLHSKLGCLLFSKGSSNSGTTLHGGEGKKELYFPLLRSVKRQKVPLGRSISTNFVADCCLVHFWSQIWCLPSQFHWILNYINNNGLPCAQVNALTASCLLK